MQAFIKTVKMSLTSEDRSQFTIYQWLADNYPSFHKIESNTTGKRNTAQCYGDGGNEDQNQEWNAIARGNHRQNYIMGYLFIFQLMGPCLLHSL